MKSIHLTVILLCLSLVSFSQKPYKASDLTDEHLFTTNCEGPAVDSEGNLYVVNYKDDGTVAVIRPGKSPELFVRLPHGSVGNGIRFNKTGEMFVADFKGHNVLKVDMKTKAVSVFAHDERMNQPNDLAISNSGIIFCSDPNWQDNTGQLWKVMPDGKSVLLESGMGTTNGIEVSPDDKHLYVNESIQKRLWVYDIDNEGNISNKRLLYQFPDFGLDGMRCDAKGNLFVARYDKGVVAIISPAGKLLREVEIKGKKTSNVTFGGKKNKTVFVTLQDRGGVEQFRSKTKGAR
jgi:sugar lactone lactonase YvrE